MLFDTHAHYDDDQFDGDRETLLTSLPEQGVGLVVNPGCTVASSRTAVELARRFPHVYAAVGIHPENCGDFRPEDLDAIRALAREDKVVAIGEIGLDYYWPENPPRPLQQQVLRSQLALARELVVCTFYDELLPLVKEKGVYFRCTAAVGGGIGWLSELERARRVQSIREVGGIMNGTCNYILDNMTRQGLNYDDVLKQAQALGYAEANPSTDVDGIDTWHKVILSSNIAFGVSLDKETVPVAGIRNIKAEDVENFKAHGLVCKLISTGKRENGVISAYVQPTLVRDGEPEAAVPMNYNLITFIGETSQRMSFFGQGAGRYPTAYNVVQDLVDVLAGKGFYAPYGGHAAAVNDEKLTWYVRGNWNGETKAHWGNAAVTAPVSVAKMHAWLKENPDAFAAAIRE